MWLLLSLLACAGRDGAIQVDLRGWTNYLESPVVVSDEDLATKSGWATEQLQTVLWRQERCRLRELTCRTEVRVFRNRHFGDHHLTTGQITHLLTEAGAQNISVQEKLGGTPVSGGPTCHVVVRVLPG